MPHSPHPHSSGRKNRNHGLSLLRKPRQQRRRKCRQADKAQIPKPDCSLFYHRCPALSGKERRPDQAGCGGRRNAGNPRRSRHDPHTASRADRLALPPHRGFVCPSKLAEKAVPRCKILFAPPSLYSRVGSDTICAACMIGQATQNYSFNPPRFWADF